MAKSDGRKKPRSRAQKKAALHNLKKARAVKKRNGKIRIRRIAALMGKKAESIPLSAVPRKPAPKQQAGPHKATTGRQGVPLRQQVALELIRAVLVLLK